MRVILDSSIQLPPHGSTSRLQVEALKANSTACLPPLHGPIIPQPHVAGTPRDMTPASAC